MNKETFWAIIEKAKDSDTEIMYSNLLEEIAENDLQAFNSCLGAYMELVNETIWLDMACKVINGYVSDDTGLYFTLWVIAQGEDVLLRSLNDPDSLSELSEIPFGNAAFEMLMAVGIDVDAEEYEPDSESMEKISQRAELMERLREKAAEEISPTIKFKGGEKYGEYETFEDAMEDIPNVLPELIKRAEMEGFDWKNYI